MSARDLAHRMAIQSAERILADDMSMMLKSEGGSAAVYRYVSAIESALLPVVRQTLAAQKRIKRNARLIEKLSVASAPSHTQNGNHRWQ